MPQVFNGVFPFMIAINKNVDLLNLDDALDKLSVERLEKALSYRNEQDRKLSAAAYILLRECLYKEYGITEKPKFSYGSYGKPFLAEFPMIHFNLSHSGNIAACIVDTSPVGIDVEVTGKYSFSLAKSCMNINELKDIASSHNPEFDFLKLWTMKESFSKLKGDGITNDFRYLLNSTTGINWETNIDYSCGYVMSIARFQHK